MLPKGFYIEHLFIIMWFYNEIESIHKSFLQDG
jgi:hypothetical protein